MKNEAISQYTSLVGNTAKYPFLVGVSAGINMFGSAILLDPQYALTCNHLGRQSADSPDRMLADIVFVSVITPQGPIGAQVRAADPEIDLVLLELERPFPAKGPSFIDSPLQAGSVLMAAGVQIITGNAECLAVAETKLKCANTNDMNGKTLDIQFEGGARPGYSGGPMILCHNGLAYCAGIIRWGGTWSYSSNVIGVARIQAFLDEHLPLRNFSGLTRTAVKKAAMANTAKMDLRQMEILARSGDQEMQFQLALAYADPGSPYHKPETAVHWLLSAADQGHAESAFRLAWAYRRGEGVLHSESEALCWFRKAAKMGHPGAQTVLGLMLLEGRAGEKNQSEAARMFELAVRQGDMEARYQLAMLQLEGCEGMPRNEFKALEAFRQVAETGRPDAQFQLASMLAHGLGLPPDPVEALRWAEEAAAQGHHAAQDLARELNSDLQASGAAGDPA
jgi:TPR repeat protein